MRIAREQMLCIISPEWAGGSAAMSAPVLASLQALCRDVGVVHFASMALLPPRPKEPAGQLPSLLLELAVDEGIRPADLLARLVHHPEASLWNLYQSYWPDVLPATVGQRNDALFQFLLPLINVADGAFVGPRDRTVDQITKERRLFESARAYARTVPAALKANRAAYARTLARWAFQSPEFDSIAGPAPRSFWRTPASGPYIARFAKLVVAFLLVLAMGLGLLFSGAEFPDSAVAALLVGLRLLVAVIGALAVVFVFGLLRALIRPLDRWLTALVREFERPNDAWSARVAYVFGWWVAIGIGFAGCAAAVYVGRGLDDLLKFVDLTRPEWMRAASSVYVVFFVSLLAILIWGLQRTRVSANATLSKPGTDRLRRAFRRPIDEAIPRAQQVHESIERCEADLVAGTAHMISLTELRWPMGWSAWWTRRVLRIVSSLGHILFTEGPLGNAPGIQYAHWHIVDGGRRLLFCANFDGTFGGYLDDFILGPSGGTTLFWRWTCLKPRLAAASGHPDVAHVRAFPPTRFLVYRGVKCELKFKAYARDSMIPHLFRFDASGLTLEQKLRGTAFREALFSARSDVNDDAIMRALES